MTAKVRSKIGDLFNAFIEAELLPPQLNPSTESGSARSVADYIICMTNHYFIREHRLQFAVEEEQKNATA